MTRPRPRIGSELLPVVLILGCLAGTLFLVVSMHRRALDRRKAAKAVVVASPAPPRVDPPPPPPAPVPVPAPTPVPPPEDPTRKELARLGAEEAEQLLAAREADRKAEALEKARMAAEAESERWRRREVMARAQIDDLDARARKLEDEAEALATERDVLAMERDASKAALARAKNRSSSFAVLPHKGPNGTWRRPIILECRDGTAILQPNGTAFTLLDLSTLLSPRSSPVINVILREMIRTRGMATPDGAPAVPYIFFVVRPDGIRPYYEARARLEPLGIAFGYELVEQDAEIEYPDLEDLAEWDGSGPPLSASPSMAEARDAPRPSLRPGRDGGNRGGGADSFVWPTRPPNAPGGGDLADLEKPPGYPDTGGGGGGNGTGDRPGRGGPGPGDGGGAGDPWLVDRDGRGGAGPGTDTGRGGNGSEPAYEPGMYGGRHGGSPGFSAPNPAGSPGGGSLAGGGRYGLEPLSADRLPGLEEASPLGRLEGSGSGSSDHSGPALEAPSVGGMPQEGTPGDGGHGHALDDSGGSGTGSGGSGQQRAAGGQGSRGGRGGAQANASGVPVGVGSMAPGQGSGGSSSSAGQGSGGSSSSAGQPSQGTGIAGSPGGSGDRGPSSGSPSGGSPPLGRPLRIDAPLEIVVACGPEGVVLHPGGYRISKEVLKGKEPMLTRHLATIVRLRQQVDPMIRPIPSLRFLVEPGGNDTYRDARKQTVLSGLDWPIALQLGDSQILDYLPGERF